MTRPAPPRRSLVAAALAGLLDAGCKEKTNVVEVPADAPEITASRTDRTMTTERFVQECDDRGGLVQHHAACAGVNSCRGVTLHGAELIEHTCRGVNTCAGVSCVQPAADRGLTGKAVYEETCADCHGSRKFTLFVGPDADETAALAAFSAASPARRLYTVAFGVAGRTADGTAYANMPAYHKRYSRAEMERAAAYAASLEVQPAKVSYAPAPGTKARKP